MLSGRQRKPSHIELICVGTELLTGKVNTHAAYLGVKLEELGLSLTYEHTVSDDPRLMHQVFRRSFQQSDVVICAGGLGPTFDDITRDVWSKVIGRPLQLRPWLVSDIQEKFRKRGLVMPPANRRQAMVLKGGEVLAN